MRAVDTVIDAPTRKLNRLNPLNLGIEKLGCSAYVASIERGILTPTRGYISFDLFRIQRSTLLFGRLTPATEKAQSNTSNATPGTSAGQRPQHCSA